MAIIKGPIVNPAQTGQMGKVKSRQEGPRSLASDFDAGTLDNAATKKRTTAFVTSLTSKWLPPFESEQTATELDQNAREGGGTIARFATDGDGQPVPALNLTLQGLGSMITNMTGDDASAADTIDSAIKQAGMDTDPERNKKVQELLQGADRAKTRMAALQSAMDASDSPQVTQTRDAIAQIMSDRLQGIDPSKIRTPVTTTAGSDPDADPTYINNLYAYTSLVSGSDLARAMYSFNSLMNDKRALGNQVLGAQAPQAGLVRRTPGATGGQVGGTAGTNTSVLTGGGGNDRD